MIARYQNLSRNPKVFKSMTGLHLNEFILLAFELVGQVQALRLSRLQDHNRTRQRVIGGGTKPHLDERNQLLLAVIWLRLYPTNETLGYLFNVSDSTVSRVRNEVVPLLAANGKDTFKMPQPNRKQRRNLDDLIREVPDLDVLVDSFEQRVQRHQNRAEADRYYSGKKKQHTLKTQVSVDATTGLIVHISHSVVGPTNDLDLLKSSGLVEALPQECKAGGDLAYVGINKYLPGRGFTPRRKPRGKDRPAEDVVYNRAFSKKRIVVEHSIGRLRHYQVLVQMDRQHRDHEKYTQRVIAVAGLVNRHLVQRLSSHKNAA